jgi:YVTN family beta-propeller protein
VRAPVVTGLVFAALLLSWLSPACDEHFPAPPPPATVIVPSTVPAIIPPAQRKSASSSRVVFDPLRGGVWTANGDVGSISYIDVDARVARHESRFGGDITSVALSPDAVWVAAVDRSGGSVVLFDAETLQARGTLPVGGHPRSCVWDAANPRWLYVAVEDDGTVAVVDAFLGQVAAKIDVGRLPSGLAVSSSRRELYVAHRIDARLTLVDLHDRTVTADIPLADEPFTALKTPNGKPFAFEAPAVTHDGRYAWLSHELLAPTHPFVFDATLFPAISVVDLVNRVEAQTDPNLPNILGRKNLFDAINLIGTDGQPEVFSQLCAVAIHPRGFVGWALACASEDLLVFDVSAGIATDAIRGLPLDHPLGVTLDDTGQRLFVLGDQSHTLVTLDTANGSLVQHTRLYGDPIPTLRVDNLVCSGVTGSDPCDPVATANATLRRGLTLFFGANSSKGVWASTGDNWMSCGGCHLDGFTSTNARFFEALSPADPAKDALIGHVGLVDHFSTVVDPSKLNPHDLLVALLDQGGLAPDRTGHNRAGAVDPNNPLDSPNGAAAVTMAQQLAPVVARDLPVQPSWEHPVGAPNAAWDAQFCGNCHTVEFEAWSASVHSRAASDKMVVFCLDQEPQFQRQCSGCHDPIVGRLDQNVAADAGSQQPRHGVTCLGCHDVEREMRAGGNGDFVTVAHADWAGDHKARALASLDTLREPEFCGGCHQQFVPGNGFAAISTYSEYHASSYAASGTRCVDCHMQKDAAGVANHRFPGGNIYLGQVDAKLLEEQQRNLAAAVQLAATRTEGGVQVIVTNRGAGHSFPTGVTDLRELWVEVQQAGNMTPYGGPGADGLLPPDAARLGTDIADADGGILLRHELSAVARMPFDLRVPANQAQSLFVPVPSSVPTSSLQAVLYYRNVRTTYYRAATLDTTGHAPDFEVARIAVQVP